SVEAAAQEMASELWPWAGGGRAGSGGQAGEPGPVDGGQAGKPGDLRRGGPPPTPCPPAG
ncbi:MAG: hypothetical protein ACRDZX_09015, partial [Acidimicrobiales bacterium]